MPMKPYRVLSEVEVIAATPRDAARIAQRVHQKARAKYVVHEIGPNGRHSAVGRPFDLSIPASDKMGAFYEIRAADVGRKTIRAFGRDWITAFMGGIRDRDVEKRIYQRGDILQVENDEQRARRLALPETHDEVHQAMKGAGLL